jgi:hypothetical protein
MKNLRIILSALAIALTALFPSVVGAQTIRERELNQQQRIAKGLQNGSLTAAEAARLEKREAALLSDLRTERRIHDGKLTPAARKYADKKLDALSHQIRAARHNGRRQ